MNFTGEMIEQFTLGLMLTSLRILGLFLTAPMLSFKALSLPFRVMLAVLIGFLAMPLMDGTLPIPTSSMKTFYSAGLELAIGAFIGFTIRMGFLTIEVAAEVLSFLSGFSYASTTYRDPSLDSGLVSVFLGLIALALTFTLNVHLVLIDVVLQSFHTLPFGSWPAEWNIRSIFVLMTQSFQLGLIFSMPILMIYLMFNMIQGFLGRTSPQLNLFSVGFAFTIPLAFITLLLILPEFQGMLVRALENPLRLVREGVDIHVGRSNAK
jgi:flagellar biosynthetic protein FliR